MLQLKIDGEELYDDSTGRFVECESTVLRLEHSLVSLSKWEAKWKKAFLDTRKPRTFEESIDYIRCMCLDKNVNPEVFDNLTRQDIDTIDAYVNDSQTATWFNEQKKGPKSSEVITSELIYYWMVSYGIPFECQKWHLNRLLTLIRICNIKNAGPQKMSKQDAAAQRRMLNAQRRAKHHSRG